MVSIIDDDIWNPEPALRPEDEIILRKLHDMLQSTADDLKLLSGELSKYHEPGVQVKTAPTPLDEEFNEKVHIEEVVNAKFHGYKIVEKPLHVPEVKLRNDTIDGVNKIRTAKILNTDVGAKTVPASKRPVINKNLGISRTRIIQINGENQRGMNEKLNNGKVIKNAPAVAYNEFSFKYVEPKMRETQQKLLQVQDMPSINIRSELKEQKVLQLDIVPDSKEAKEISTIRNNVSVVAISHDIVPKPVKPVKSFESVLSQQTNSKNLPSRKVSKMSTRESSGSTNNVDSDARALQNTQKRIISAMRNSPKTSARERAKKTNAIKKETDKRQRFNVDEWKKKLNVVYGSNGPKKTKTSTKTSPKKYNVTKKPIALNNAEYIPYSHLTLGGVRVSDIEREISDLPNKTDMPLSPILDKILSSRENSFHKESPKKQHKKDNSNPILTTSDENLLQEVIDIERSVGKTLSKNVKKTLNEPVKKSPNVSSESNNGIDENDSYADDFEDEKSDRSRKSLNQMPSTDDEPEDTFVKIKYDEIDDISLDNDDNVSNDEPKPGPSNLKNKTYTKSSSLSFKDSVDIFEFVHLVDTHDTGTQSNGSSTIKPKETQTSPRNDRPNIQPIHNDLWPSIDPRRELEKMFELEKDLIKKLIIDEYGDLLEKNINKPSTSNENTLEEARRNVTALQKNTQTSPAHVKSVMTSPRKTKTRPTSPFLLTVPVHQQTSPMVVVTNEEDQRVDMAVDVDDISVNLSSPRFSLRLPLNSHEVFSNLEDQTPSQSKISLKKEKLKNKVLTKTSVSSTSSVDAERSSSEISSLGEVRIRKKLKKRAPSTSEYSSSSTVSKNSYDLHSTGILPLRSEGEISLGQISRKRLQKCKSDGETSFGHII